MVLMNLFAGQEQRLRCRGWTCGHEGKERMGGTARVALIQKPLCAKQRPSGELLCSTGAQPGPVITQSTGAQPRPMITQSTGSQLRP